MVLGLVASALTLAPAALEAPGSTVAAAQSPTNAFDADDICGGSGSVHGEWDPKTVDYYGRVWVPAGATLSWVSSGFLIPTNYWGAPQANDQLDVFIMSADDTTQLDYDRVSLGYSPATYDPIAWTVAAESWSNPGPDRFVLVRTGAYTGAYNGRIAAGNMWTVAVTVTGGDGSDGPACQARADDEADVPNASMPNACGAQPNAADPVNVVQGNFWQSWADVVLPGRGPGLALERTHSSSRADADGSMGFGWSWSYGMSLVESSGVVSVRQENGAMVRFSSAGALWLAPERVNATLVENGDGSWTFARSGTEVFGFSPAGALTSVSDLSGNTVTLSYVGTELAAVTDASGRQLLFTWSGGRITKVTAPAAVLEPGGTAVPIEVSYGYDAAGDLASVTEADGGVWTFTYDGSHRLVTIREPRHHALGAAAPVVENHYDAEGRVDWQQDRLDRRTTFDWATPGQTAVTDPTGNVVVYEHQDGVCTGIVRDPGPDESRWIFEVDLATLGRTSTTDPNGTVTTATFTDRGLPETVTDPSGTATIVYNAQQLPASVTDASGVTTTFTYDAGTDRLRTVSRPITPGTGTWSVTLNYTDPANPGLPTELVDARGQSWSYAYDEHGNLVSVTDPTGRTSTTTYNALGWPLNDVAPAGNAPGGVPAEHITTRAYNTAGEVVAVTDPLGAITEYGLDPSGYLAWVRDPVPTGELVEETQLAWNAAGELVTVTRPDGTTTGTEYWPNGSLKAQRDGATNATSYAYDSQGRLRTVTDPAGRTTIFGYDPGGRVVSRQEPGGDCAAPTPVGCVTYTYTAAGHLEAIDYSDPVTADVTFGYDALGRRTSMVDQAGASTWVWDSIGRLLSFTDPVTGTVGYDYADAGPDATSVTYPGGKVMDRTFDPAGRQDSLTGWTGGTTTFGWDDNTNPTTTDTAATPGVEDAVGYDRANRPTAFTLRQDQSVLATLGYTRDPEGMVRTSTGSGLPGVEDVFGYTGLDQLASDSSGSYTFDAADNLTGFPDGRRQRFNAANELCYVATTNTAPCGSAPADATTFDYDHRGNRTAGRPAGGIPSRYEYDQADRLTSAEVPALADGQGQYHPIPGARVLASSPAQGSCVPSPCGPLTANTPVRVQVTGVAGVPTSGVESVTLAVHVATPATDGWLHVDPSDATGPTAVGLLYNVGQDTTNTVIVKPGPDGRIRLESLANTGIYIDVLGWHGTEPAPAGGMLYETAAAPARVMSTSPASGTCTPSPCARLAAWGTTTVQVTGINGVPTDDVTAVAVVAHATNPAGTGWLTMWPTGSATPGAGQLAYDGRHASALTVVPVGPAGTIEIFSSKATDLLLDVVGWYGPATRGEGLVAHQSDPELLTDTRTGLGTCNPAPCSRLAAGFTTTTQVAGKAGIPADADAVAVIVHAINPTNPGWLVAWQPGQPVPGTANLTYGGGSFISGTAAIPVDDQGNIALWSSTPVDIVVQTVGWYEQATRTWTYQYAGDGLRRSKTAPDGTTTTYTWDRASGLPLLLAETIDAPGTNDDRTTRYLHGPAGRTIADITEPASGVETLRWYHHDQLGSTRALTDHTGTIIGTSAYTPFGELAASTGTATTPIGWAGEYKDTETGFIYLRARYYDPATGQFLTRDPAVALTRDPYGYAANNPTNFTDPSGLCPFCVAFVVGAAVGGGLDLGFQMLGNVAGGCGALDDINWSSVGTNALIGGGLSAGGAWLASGRAGAALRGVNWADDTGAVGIGGLRGGRAVESFGGTLTQDQAIPAALRWLGESYTELGPGRYLSANGVQGIRWGAHETRGAIQHIHFETWENGRVVWNTVAHIL